MAKQKKIVLLLYTILFYAIWATFELVVKGILDNTMQNEVLCQFVKSGVIKNLVWTLPAILLVQHFQSDVSVPLTEMVTTTVNWLKYLPIFILFTVYIWIGSILQNGKLGIASAFGINECIIVLFVGMTEEMVFRGWLLNATLREGKKWLSILINAVMFLIIHFRHGSPKAFSSAALRAWNF